VKKNLDDFYIHTGIMIMLRECLKNTEDQDTIDYLIGMKQALLKNYESKFPLELYDLLEKTVEED